MGHYETLAAYLDLPGKARGLGVLGDALKWLDLPESPSWLCDLDTLRIFEGRPAQAYFATWRGNALRWTKGDALGVLPRWPHVQVRNSPLLRSARPAVDSCNTVLSYAYALLECQCRQAPMRLGFDVARGFLHVDKRGRDSLVYDLMECERSTVDGLILDFLARTVLHYGDVSSVSDGSCRLHLQPARAIVAGCRVRRSGWVRAHALGAGHSAYHLRCAGCSGCLRPVYGGDRQRSQRQRSHPAYGQALEVVRKAVGSVAVQAVVV